jgi:hypothetical protein
MFPPFGNGFTATGSFVADSSRYGRSRRGEIAAGLNGFLVIE